MATGTSAETKKLEDKLDALVNFVTQLAANQKPASVARVCSIHSSNDHHSSVCPSSQESRVDEHPEAYAANTYSRHHKNARNDAIVIRGVHDLATDTFDETRKLESKLDALVNLVTQLATNQKLASVARVYDINSSNDNHTSVCPYSQQSGVDEHPEAYAANTYNSSGPTDDVSGGTEPHYRPSFHPGASKSRHTPGPPAAARTLVGAVSPEMNPTRPWRRPWRKEVTGGVGIPILDEHLHINKRGAIYGLMLHMRRGSLLIWAIPILSQGRYEGSNQNVPSSVGHAAPKVLQGTQECRPLFRPGTSIKLRISSF
ncbi:hypothetical protein Fmac_028740 [Flemingia macrophylla]|uniref:Uncharacterized protein n=1 Tax=Flemingia macrophylla TaxID=520843 RepID=A0ABD1L8G0_9FABA